MKVRVNEDARQRTNYGTIELLPGKVYEAQLDSSLLKDWYCIVDESGEDYLYPPSLFDIVEE